MRKKEKIKGLICEILYGVFLVILIVAGAMLMTGCSSTESEKITLEGRTVETNDDVNITLNKGWYASGYHIDYENKQIVIDIEKDREE